MIFLYLLGVVNIVRSELIVSSPDEISRERLEREATLLDSVERETECEAVTEREDTYEVIIESDGERTYHEYVTVARVEDNSLIEVELENSPTHTLRRHLNCLDQEDPKLIEAMREHYIRIPEYEVPYNGDENFAKIQQDEGVADYLQDEILDTLLFQGKIKNGFFIEAGAWDFTSSSNSLWYELKHNWTGLLIEPMLEMCYKGQNVNRKAYSSCSCISTFTKPSFVEVEKDINFMGLVTKEEPGSVVQVPGQQCFPLFSYLKALDYPTVNLLSLDIEGAEFGVLKTVPWDKVDIEVLLIELIHAGSHFKGSREEIHQFLLSKNYVYLGTISVDDVFVRKDLLKSKYDFVDFSSVEKHHNWCKHYSDCECRKPPP